MTWGFIEGMWTGMGLAYAGGILGGAYLWWRKRKAKALIVTGVNRKCHWCGYVDHPVQVLVHEVEVHSA